VPIEFRCTSCDALLRLPDNAASSQAKCPQCGTIVTVPSSSIYDAPSPGSPGASTEENPFQAPSASGCAGDPFAMGTFELATRGQRFLGKLIDNMIMFAAVVVVVGIGAFLIGMGDEDVFVLVVQALAGLVSLAVSAVQWVLIVQRGQTVGKIVMGTRIIVGNDPGLPGFVAGVAHRSWVPGLIAMVPCVGPIFGLVDALWIFGEEKRCLHDLIANTRVVKV